MTTLELVLTGVALAMDAFAVSITEGLKMGRIRYKETFIIALFFGGFQALMPFLGWKLGSAVSGVIDAYDHWAAFILLVIIGTKNVIEALRENEEDAAGESGDNYSLNIGELFLLAIATSIDALAVGVAFALGYTLSIYRAIAIIGGVTFLICFSGVFIGKAFGTRYRRKAEVAGGIILIAIGVRILLNGLGLFA